MVKPSPKTSSMKERLDKIELKAKQKRKEDNIKFKKLYHNNNDIDDEDSNVNDIEENYNITLGYLLPVNEANLEVVGDINYQFINSLSG